MTPDLINALSGIGLTGGLIVAVWAFTTGKLVTAPAHARTQTDCEARVARVEATNETLRAEMRETDRAALAASAKQLEAAAKLAEAHQEERRLFLSLLGKEAKS